MQVECGSYLLFNLLNPYFAQSAFVGCLGVRVAVQFMGQAQPEGFKVMHGLESYSQVATQDRRPYEQGGDEDR